MAAPARPLSKTDRAGDLADASEEVRSGALECFSDRCSDLVLCPWFLVPGPSVVPWCFVPLSTKGTKHIREREDRGRTKNSGPRNQGPSGYGKPKAALGLPVVHHFVGERLALRRGPVHHLRHRHAIGGDGDRARRLRRLAV